MQSLTPKEFNRRWAKAQKKSASPLACKVSTPTINITLENVLDNYARQLTKAQAAHVIDEARCQAICAAIAELKSAVQPVSGPLKSFMKT